MLAENDSDVIIFSDTYGKKNGLDNSYENHRFIQQAFQFHTKQSMDGARVFYLVAEDRASNLNITFGFMLIIHNKVLLQREVIAMSIIGVIMLVVTNELVKKFLIKVDLLDAFDKIKQLPQRISTYLNKDPKKNRYGEN